jgi:hypothetical protein
VEAKYVVGGCFSIAKINRNEAKLIFYEDGPFIIFISFKETKCRAKICN